MGVEWHRFHGVPRVQVEGFDLKWESVLHPTVGDVCETDTAYPSCPPGKVGDRL